MFKYLFAKCYHKVIEFLNKQVYLKFQIVNSIYRYNNTNKVLNYLFDGIDFSNCSIHYGSSRLVNIFNLDEYQYSTLNKRLWKIKKDNYSIVDYDVDILRQQFHIKDEVYLTIYLGREFFEDKGILQINLTPKYKESLDFRLAITYNS